MSPPSAPLTELTLRNLGGVFVVLLVGSFFAVLLGCCEFLLKTRMSTLDSSTYRQDLWEDFKFALSCNKSTKVLKRKSVKSLTDSRVFDNRVISQPNGNGNGNSRSNFNLANEKDASAYL